MDKNQPKIQTVVNKIDMIHNDYRTMQLEVLAGNHSLVTTVVENGLRFSVDLATVYVLISFLVVCLDRVSEVECLVDSITGTSQRGFNNLYQLKVHETIEKLHLVSQQYDQYFCLSQCR